MSITVDRKHERVIVQIERVDRRYGTGRPYRTSVTVDAELMGLLVQRFDGHKDKAQRWLEQQVKQLDCEFEGVDREPALGFSRLVQRAIVREVVGYRRELAAGAGGKRRKAVARQVDEAAG